MSVPNEFDRGGGWLPWATGILIALLYLAARVFPGYWTWPFNAVAYWPGEGGLVFTLSCLVLLLLATVFLPRLESLRPPPVLAAAVFAALALLFLAAVAYSPVWLPSLEGDGAIDHEDPAARLANLLVGWIQDVTELDEQESVAVASRVMACVYIAGAAAFAVELLPGFWSRLTAFLFLAAFPAVVNFSGHYDSYSVSYACLSATAALAFLAARRRSPIYLAAALLAFALSVKAHRYAAIFAVYPACWLWLRFLDRRRISGAFRRVMVAAAPAALLLGGIALARRGIPIYAPREDFGRWLGVARAARGLPAALAVPLLLLFSFLAPYALAVGASVSRRRSPAGDRAVAAALLGSLGIILVYYAIQVLNPISCYGILDFVCQSGSLGGLFAIPALVIAAEHFPRRIYAVTVFSIFLTVPSLVLQGTPKTLERLLAGLGNDLSSFFIDRSPYPLIGRKLRFAARRRPEFRRAVAAVYERGMEERGFYRPFAPFSAFSLMGEQYVTGEVFQARLTLERLLTRWPRPAVFLILARPDLFRPLSDALSSELARMSARIEAATGESIYERIVLGLQAGKRRIVHPTPREYAAVLAALDALGSGGGPGGPDLAAAAAVLDRYGLIDLLHPPPAVPAAPAGIGGGS